MWFFFFRVNIWTIRDVRCQVSPPFLWRRSWPPSWTHVSLNHSLIHSTKTCWSLSELILWTHWLIHYFSQVFFWTSSKIWDLCFTLRMVPAFLWNLWSSSILLWFKWHHLFCKFIIFPFFLHRRVEVLIYLCIDLKITYTKLFHSESSINSLLYYYYYICIKFINTHTIWHGKSIPHTGSSDTAATVKNDVLRSYSIQHCL